MQTSKGNSTDDTRRSEKKTLAPYKIKIIIINNTKYPRQPALPSTIPISHRTTSTPKTPPNQRISRKAQTPTEYSQTEQNPEGFGNQSHGRSPRRPALPSSRLSLAAQHQTGPRGPVAITDHDRRRTPGRALTNTGTADPRPLDSARSDQLRRRPRLNWSVVVRFTRSVYYGEYCRSPRCCMALLTRAWF